MGWAPETVEHTFTTGRKARIYAALDMAVVKRQAIADGTTDILDAFQELAQAGAVCAECGRGGGAKDPVAAQHLEDAIVKHMWVRPRVVDDDEAPDPDEGDDPEVIPLRWLQSAERFETTVIAWGGVAAAAMFRDVDDGPGDRSHGEDVGDAPKPRRGAAKRKR